MTRRRSAVWIAIGAVALAVVAIVAIGRYPVESSRDDRVATGTRPVSKNSESKNSEIIAAPSSARISADKPPRLPVDARFAIPTASSSSQLPTLKIDDPKWEARRQEFWETLVAFAVRADLSESEWERFLGDVSDVASSEIDAYKPAVDPNTRSEEVLSGLRDAVSLNSELAHDLDVRLASWMTERQWKIYDGRLGSDTLLSRTRRLRMIELLLTQSSATPAIVSDARR